MLLAGLLLRNIPYINNAVTINVHWSAALRNIALSIILTRAGLGLDPAVSTLARAHSHTQTHTHMTILSGSPHIYEGFAPSEAGVCAPGSRPVFGGGLRHRCGISSPVGSTLGLGLHAGVKRIHTHTVFAIVALMLIYSYYYFIELS